MLGGKKRREWVIHCAVCCHVSRNTLISDNYVTIQIMHAWAVCERKVICAAYIYSRSTYARCVFRLMELD